MEAVLTITLILFFLIALISGSPLYSIIAGAAVLLFSLVADNSMSIVIIEMNRLANAPGLIAIPLFIFAGFIFAESNSSSRLIKLSGALLGWMPGGLAIVAVLVCTLFTALTGGSGITIIAVGGILMPALIKEGYSKNFSTGLIAASGSSGVLFVPSLPIIIYGMVTKTDITQLFIAGILPGLLIIACLSGFGIFHGVKSRIPSTHFSPSLIAKSIWQLKWIIPLPFIVIGGIYSGFITIGEAAAVAAFYALLTECLIYKEIPFDKLISITIESMIMTGAILIVLASALGLTNFMVDQEIPQKIMLIVTDNISGKIMFLIALNIFLLIVGCLMDIFSAIVVVAPLVAPVAAEFNIDPVHLGIIFLANLEIGYLTPPVGINLFISSLRFEIPVIRLYKTVIPFLILLVIALLIISYWPQLSLFLLDLSGKRVPLLQI